MSTFTSGLTQGLNSVNNLWRSVNNKEYQDEQLGLRQADQAMREREFSQNDQFRHDSLAQQKQMHDDNEAMQKQFHNDDLGLRQLGLKLQQQQAQMSNQWRQFQEGVENYRQQQEGLKPLAGEAVQILSNGGTLPEALIAKLSVPGSPFNPSLVASQDYGDALNGLIGDVNKDPNRWNTPDNARRASILFSPELNSMVGKVDPHNGKRIKGSVFTRFVPSSDGKMIAPEVKTDYVDGTSETAPLTKFRSSHPDDVPIAIPTDKASQQIWARKAYLTLLSKDPNLQAVAGGGNKSTRAALAKDISGLEKDRIKADAGIPGKSMSTDSKVIQSLIDDNDRRYKELEDRLPALYGLSGTDNSSEQEQPTEDIQREQIVRDPDYSGFRTSLVSRSNPVDPDALVTADLSELFETYKQNHQKNDHAKSMADQMRSNYQKSDN